MGGNLEGRLRRLEAALRAEGGRACSCSGPLVLWPGEEQTDTACPLCGRERTVLRVEYKTPVPLEPEEQKKDLEYLTPEQRKEIEERVVAGETTIFLPPREGDRTPGGGLQEYHKALREKLLKE